MFAVFPAFVEALAKLDKLNEEQELYLEIWKVAQLRKFVTTFSPSPPGPAAAVMAGGRTGAAWAPRAAPKAGTPAWRWCA